MIVLDNSAAVDALRVADGTEQLRARIRNEELHAPTLLDYEFTATVRGLTLGRHVTVSRAKDLLTDFDSLRVMRWPSADALRRRAFELRNNISACDAAYLVLAEALSCPLITRDVRLGKTAGHDVMIEVF